MISGLLSSSWGPKIIFFSGLLHLTQIPGMVFAPRILKWKQDLAGISPINRIIFVVLIGGVMITVFATGMMVMLNSSRVIDGSRFAASFCCFLAVFWSYRFFIQVVVYTRIWPMNMVGKLSHIGLVFLFGYQSFVYWISFIYNIAH